MAKYILAKDVLSKYSITYSRLNHYTDMGLLPMLKRGGNKRVYEQLIVDKRLPLIKKLIAQGYPLGVIRKIILENK
jgi:DNA-binding transcriptional MerR regulator